MSREGSGGRLLNGRANSGASSRKKMSGDHPRNTAPMLASLRCGAKTRGNVLRELPAARAELPLSSGSAHAIGGLQL